MPQSSSGTTRQRATLPPAGEGRDIRWDIVERVCNAPQLRRSGRLRELLVYLCHRAWTDGAQEIREHEIGIEVFDRAPSYDSAQETIVRVQASQLRKRLEQYFAEDGLGEPRILSIPKGCYVPDVRDRAEGSQIAPPPVAIAPDRRLVIGLAISCFVLAIACGGLVYRQSLMSPPSAAGPTLQKFWSAFSAGGKQTFIVVADSAVSALQDVLHRPIGLNEYVRRSYKEDLHRPDLSSEVKDMVGYLAERRYTSLADVMFVRRVSVASVLDPSKTTIVFARDHNLRAFQEGNHILVGSRRAVPWVELFKDSLDFEFVYDEKTRTIFVDNRKPLPGEPKRFVSSKQGVAGGESFSLIACVPNLARTGYVLILSGQEVSATEAAGNIVTTESLLKPLMERLPRRPDGGLPYFEALLQTRHLEYTSQDFQLLALHLH